MHHTSEIRAFFWVDWPYEAIDGSVTNLEVSKLEAAKKYTFVKVPDAMREKSPLANPSESAAAASSITARN